MAIGLPSFKNGVHPHEHKDATAHQRTELMPFVDRYVLPLGQHIGAPCKPIVHKGQQVRRGERIADPGGFVSIALHSPVTGTVTAVAERRHPNGSFMRSIEIEADPYSTQKFEAGEPIDWRGLSDDEFVREVQNAGLVGLGGAAFPSHVKYTLKPEQNIERLVLNGCECEPYLTCDHRLMVERTAAVVRGIEILATRLGVKTTTIGVEDNKPESVTLLRQEVAKLKQAGSPLQIAVEPVKVKYPQGAEKMLIKSLFGEEVPSGGLPLDLGIIVNNVGTMAALADWFDRRMPLIDRYLTVSGPGVPRPINMLVPIGTPVRAVLAQCGGPSEDTVEVIMGGPMMGHTVASLDAPVLKGTSGLLAFTAEEVAYPDEQTCIKCGRCLEACALYLNPSRLGKLARAGRWDQMVSFHINDCMECGACSYACPSAIPLVQLIRVGKSALRDKANKQRAQKDQANKKGAAK